MKMASLFRCCLVLQALALVMVALPTQSISAAEYKEYKLGMTCPRSGDQKFIGDMQLAGVEIAIDEINSKGGIDGIPIKLIVEDNQAKPVNAVLALQKLISVDKVPLAFTTYSTTQLAQAPIADKKKVVMINTGATGAELIHSGKYIVHVQPNAVDFLRIAINYMCENVGLKGKRWAIAYSNDAMGMSFNNYARSVLPKYGVKEIFSDNWQAPATDFRPIVAKIVDFKADAVFLAGWGKENALCLKQLKEAGYTGKVLSSYGGDVVSKEVGPSTVDGVYYAEQLIPDNDRIKVLKEKILNVRKLTMFHTQSINSYDAVYLVAEAIKYAKDHNRGSYFTGEKLLKAIVDKKQFDTLSTPGTLDPAIMAVSRQLGVKVMKDQGGKAVDETVKVYGAQDIKGLPEGKVK